MGARLNAYYAQASKEFGVVGRMKLAMLTKITSEKAQTEADSPDNIRLFERALIELRTAAA